MLLALLTLTSPLPPVSPACDDQGYPLQSLELCRRSCGWWSKAEKRCRDADMEVIGTWDPRPAPSEWPHSSYERPAQGLVEQ